MSCGRRQAVAGGMDRRDQNLYAGRSVTVLTHLLGGQKFIITIRQLETMYEYSLKNHSPKCTRSVNY
jgi:hypothetical protein